MDGEAPRLSRRGHARRARGKVAAPASLRSRLESHASPLQAAVFDRSKKDPPPAAF